MSQENQLKWLRYVSLGFFFTLVFLVWCAFCDDKWSELYKHYEPSFIQKYPTYEAHMASSERWFYVIVVAYNMFGGLSILLDWAFCLYNRNVSSVFHSRPDEVNEFYSSIK